MKSVLYLVEKTARVIVNDLGHLEVQRATKCSNCNHYFWESVGAHKSTPNGMQKALLQYFMTILYVREKKIYDEALKKR